MTKNKSTYVISCKECDQVFVVVFDWFVEGLEVAVWCDDQDAYVFAEEVISF
jgi:hypothetical protein